MRNVLKSVLQLIIVVLTIYVVISYPLAVALIIAGLGLSFVMVGIPLILLAMVIKNL